MPKTLSLLFLVLLSPILFSWDGPRSVATVIAERGLFLLPSDRVSPPLPTHYRGQVIRLERRNLVAVPPPARRIPDTTLFRGEEMVVRAGRLGYSWLCQPYTFTADSPIHLGPIQSSPLIRPVPAVLRSGTAVPHYLVVDHVRYRYRLVREMIATAYNGSPLANGPWGAVARDGRPLTRGMVAVDPSVIPLGTRLYVQGYGPALAADTGSAIRGDRIDLYFPWSNAAVARFGIRVVRVYVLG